MRTNSHCLILRSGCSSLWESVLQHTLSSIRVLVHPPNPRRLGRFHWCRIPPSLVPKSDESRRLFSQSSLLGPMLLSSHGVALMQSSSCISMGTYILNRSCVPIWCNRSINSARSFTRRLTRSALVSLTSSLQTDYSSYKAANVNHVIKFNPNCLVLKGQRYVVNSSDDILACFGSSFANG